MLKITLILNLLMISVNFMCTSSEPCGAHIEYWFAFSFLHFFSQVAMEKELVPARRRLAQISETLDEKSEKLRNLEVTMSSCAL